MFACVWPIRHLDGTLGDECALRRVQSMRRKARCRRTIGVDFPVRAGGDDHRVSRAAANRIPAMSVSRGEEPRASGTSADGGALTLSGGLLLVGFVVNAIQRMIWHPTGEEDDHEAIFREYAASDAWVATHLAVSESTTTPRPSGGRSRRPDYRA